MPRFTGYPGDTLKFLAELEQNNSRAWFAQNKDRYESLVREPSLDFITAMGPQLAKLSEHFVALPRKVGGSLMRVYRDTRFGKDKTPYKTNIGIQFRHELGKDVHAPGFYLHIDNSGCFLAAGMWRPDAPALAGIRERIAFRPAEWQRVRGNRRFKSTFALGGDTLKRPPRGYAADHPQIEDLKRKDFIAATDFAADAIQSVKFVDQVTATFAKAGPLMAFLCAAVEIDY